MRERFIQFCRSERSEESAVRVQHLKGLLGITVPAKSGKYAKFFILRGLKPWSTLGHQADSSGPQQGTIQIRFQIPEVRHAKKQFCGSYRRASRAGQPAREFLRQENDFRRGGCAVCGALAGAQTVSTLVF